MVLLLTCGFLWISHGAELMADSSTNAGDRKGVNGRRLMADGVFEGGKVVTGRLWLWLFAGLGRHNALCQWQKIPLHHETKP